MTALTSPSMFQIGTGLAVPVSTSQPIRFLTPRASLHQVDLQLVTTRAGFDALEDEWNALFERAGRGEQMFQTFNWLWHWANHYLAETDMLAIVTLKRDSQLVGVLPLAVERIAGFKQLVFMGAPVSQYGDALIERVPEASRHLEQALQFAIAKTGADVVRFAKVRDDAAIAPVLARLRADVTASEEAPFADLATAGTHAAYEQRFSTKTKKNRRRLERRLADHGTVAIDFGMQGRAAADAARTAMVLKRAWLKTRGQISRAFADRRTDQFFADVCAGTQRPTGAEVSQLTAGGQIANSAITITVKGRQSLHILAYGLKFEKCAAGVLHVEKLVERAFASGVTTLDFLAPRHDYKLEWCDGAIRVADYALPVTWAGKAYTRVYLGYIREGVKTALKSVPRGALGLKSLVQAALKIARR